MADVVTSEKRSQMMAGIGGKNTRPELVIRKALHALGFRYRLHDSKFPGNPDLVLPRYKAVIFVNGCFWHCHNCHLFHWPATRPEFWRDKITGNAKRDHDNLALIRERGWKALTIWECAIKGKAKLPLNEVIEIASEWIVRGSGNLEIKGDK